jgi:hypothetical protein
MRAKTPLGLTFPGASRMAAKDQIEPPNIKFGLRGISGTVASHAQSPVPPEHLSKRTPYNDPV